MTYLISNIIDIDDLKLVLYIHCIEYQMAGLHELVIEITEQELEELLLNLSVQDYHNITVQLFKQ